MEAEKDEAIKSYNNLFSFGNIALAAQVVGVAFLGLWCIPAIVSLLQVATVCFDWFRLVISNYFYVFVVLNALIVLIFFSFCKTAEKNKPDLYDQYVAAAPTVVRASPEYNYRVTEVEDDDDDGYINNWSCKGSEPVKERNCCDRVVVEVNSKSYRRTRSEKKKKATKVEYRRTESERVTKTASWRSESMDGLSSEEFRMTVETFITQKKMMLHHQNGDVDQWQNGVVDQWQNGVPVRQNAVVDKWLNGVTQWGNGVVQWQGLPDNGTDRHRHRSRSNRLVGGSGSTGSGSYLAISN